MNELERDLARLAGELDWPPTPELATGVSARLSAEAGAPRARLPRIGLRRPLALALAALLVLAAGAVAAIPSARDSVLELLGLQGATVERRDTLPPRPELRPLQLGQRVTLEGAARSLAFTPLVPSASPDAVFVRRDVPGGELSLAYDAEATGLPEAEATGLGLLVSEFRGDLMPQYAGKIAGEATTVERLDVDGRSAIWVEGAPHFFFYRPPDAGQVADRDLRLAANVLLLQRGNVLVRLEGSFGRERAVALARSLSPRGRAGR